MTVDREEASALLADVAGMEQRTKEFLTYTKVSQSFFLWGAIWFAGYAASHYFKNQAGWIWLGLNLFGIVASVAMAARVKTKGRGFRWQIPATVLTFIFFGSLWLRLGHFDWRAQRADTYGLLGERRFLRHLDGGGGRRFADRHRVVAQELRWPRPTRSSTNRCA